MPELAKGYIIMTSRIGSIITILNIFLIQL